MYVYYGATAAMPTALTVVRQSLPVGDDGFYPEASQEIRHLLTVGDRKVKDNDDVYVLFSVYKHVEGIVSVLANTEGSSEVVEMTIDEWLSM